MWGRNAEKRETDARMVGALMDSATQGGRSES